MSHFKTPGVAFDFNGVLIDDENLHCEALCRTFAPHGVILTHELYWERYLAYDDRAAIAHVMKDFPGRVDPSLATQLLEDKIAHYAELLGDRPPFFPGALDVVRTLAAEFPSVIVSGARRAEIELALAIGGIDNCFLGIVACEDVTASKPDPESYTRGAHMLGLPPSSVVAIEDSLGGIRSARAAGVRVIAVAHSYPVEKLTPEADLVLSRISDLTAAHIHA